MCRLYKYGCYSDHIIPQQQNIQQPALILELHFFLTDVLLKQIGFKERKFKKPCKSQLKEAYF